MFNQHGRKIHAGDPKAAVFGDPVLSAEDGNALEELLTDLLIEKPEDQQVWTLSYLVQEGGKLFSNVPSHEIGQYARKALQTAREVLNQTQAPAQAYP